MEKHSVYGLLNYLYNIKTGPRPAPLAQRQRLIAEFRRKGYTPDKQFRVALKAVVGDAKGRRLTGCASSDAPDLDSDIVSLPLLQKLAKDAANLVVFTDHYYSVVSNAVGQVVAAAVVKRGAFNDLDVTLELLPEGDAVADRVWAVVQAGIPIGLSVGMMITSDEPIERGKRGLRLLDGELVEISIVGLPAQRRSRRLTPA